MFHLDIILIATCFDCTLYHFYAFSVTNLLTRCHGASSLFSVVFRFRNPRKEIFSELDEINYAINKRSGRSRSPEGAWRGPPRGPRHRRAQPRWDPRRAMAWGPHLAPDASLRLYISRVVKTLKKSRYSTKSSVAAVIFNLRSEEF